MKLTPEQIEAERVKFHKWANDDSYTIDIVIETGRYVHAYTAIAWKVWLASRENSEIESIPKMWSARGLFDGYNQAIDEMVKSLESQGFKVVTK
jgi:hypothetical protein